jgi:hypothetical protein
MGSVLSCSNEGKGSTKGALQTQLDELQGELVKERDTLNHTVQSFRAHFQNLRMVSTRQVMRLINTHAKAQECFVTPKVS